MSNFTTQVRWIVESLTPDMENESIVKRIDSAAPSIFNFDFPIYEESHRVELERKIIMHYYTREICAETVGLWKLWLNEKMNLIMPEYNMLYESVAQQYDMLTDLNTKDVYTETITRNRDETGSLKSEIDGMNSNTQNSTGNSSSKADATNNSKSVNSQLNSDLPQASIAGQDYGTEWINTDITENGGTNSTASEQNSQEIKTTGTDTTNRNDSESRNAKETETRSYEVSRTGKTQGKSYSQLILEYRNAIINVDKMIVEACGDLFFTLQKGW